SRTRQAPARSRSEIKSTNSRFDDFFSRVKLSEDSDKENNQVSARPIERISVLGAGTMGHGIAQVAAMAGYAVVMRDVNAEALAKGVRSIERNLDKAIKLERISKEDRDATLQRIRTATELAEIRDADLIIEAAPEILDLKQNLLRECGAVVSGD